MAFKEIQEIDPLRNQVKREFSANFKTVVNLFYGLSFTVFIVVVTWCVFTIKQQNKLTIKNNEQMAVNEIYLSLVRTELEVIKSKIKE